MLRKAVSVAFGVVAFVAVIAVGVLLYRADTAIGWLLAYGIAAVLVVPGLVRISWDWADRNPYR